MVRSWGIAKTKTACLVVVVAVGFSVIAPVGVVLANSDAVTTNNDQSVSSIETKNALASVPGVLSSSDQVTTKSDIDSAATTEINGSVVDVPKDASEGVAFGAESGPQLDISLPNADQAADAKKVAPGVIGYDTGNGSANAVQPTEDGGMRMLTVIDNPNAPTEYDYGVKVSGGGRVELAEDGGAFVLDADGGMLRLIGKPWAKDAAGNSIVTWFSVKDGTLLVQHVAHNVAGVVYPVTADPYYMGFYMNEAEFSWCKWPSRYNLCYRSYSLSNEATSGAQYLSRKYGWGLHNGWADANRHCYWSGLMAYHFGYDTAKGFGDRHEQVPGQPAKEKSMDLHNNEMGRRWARAQGGVWNRCILGVQRKELKLL